MTIPFAVPSRGASSCGDLTMPADAAGLVIFAHGTGSSRQSPRNMAVARSLQDRKFATLLLDLLDPAEDELGARFDLGLISTRLRQAVDEIAAHHDVAGLPLGLFGASTGVAAAIEVAADSGTQVRAIVSRGGRPDLAGSVVKAVTCPTLLIVGGEDGQVLSLNEQVLANLPGERQLHVVAGATHLLEEPGALEEVSNVAGDWFARHLRPA